MTTRGTYRILTRRAFLGSTAAAALVTPLIAAEECEVTPPNIEGPYWRANAPFTSNLRAGVSGGEPLIVAGRVSSSDPCKPISGAVLDVWQADHEGYYDMDRPGHDNPESWYLRGRIKTDAEGRYRFETIRPAPYGLAGRMRPAHIHFKIAAPGFRRLTTQLYFAGDPRLASDPLRAVRPELVRTLRRTSSGLVCGFDIVLRRA